MTDQEREVLVGRISDMENAIREHLDAVEAYLVSQVRQQNTSFVSRTEHYLKAYITRHRATVRVCEAELALHALV